MERSIIRDQPIPDYAALHPGYGLPSQGNTPLQTAIATVCLSGTLNEKLEAIAAARFKGVEIFENDLLSFDGTPAQVGRRIKDLGLAAVTFQPFRDFEGMPERSEERRVGKGWRW